MRRDADETANGRKDDARGAAREHTRDNSALGGCTKGDSRTPRPMSNDARAEESRATTRATPTDEG